MPGRLDALVAQLAAPSPGERSVAVSLAAAAVGDPALARFLVRARHLAARAGAPGLLGAAALEPAGSAARALAEAHRGLLDAWPLASTRPSCERDPCVAVYECAEAWNLAGPTVGHDGTLWVHAGSLPTVWHDELQRDALPLSPALIVTIDLETGTPVVVGSAGQFRENASRIAVSRDGRWVAVRNHRQVEIVERARAAVPRTRRPDWPCVWGPQGEGPWGGLEFLPDDRIVWMDSFALVLTDPVTGVTLATVDSAGSRAMAIAPASDRIAVVGSGSMREAIWLHALDDLRELARIPWPGGQRPGLRGWPPGPGGRHGATASAVAFAPDGAALALARDDGALYLIELAGQTARWTASAEAEIGVARFVNGVLVTGSEDGTLSVWDAATGARRARLVGHGDAVVGVAVLPDGDLVSGGRDGAVRRWRLDRAEAPAPLAGAAARPAGEAAELSFDGDAVIARLGARTARVTREGHATAIEVDGAPPGAPLPLERGAIRLRRDDDGFAIVRGDDDRPVAQECPALAVGLLDEQTAVVLDDAGHVSVFALG
jgi:hypothetical protein